MLSLAFRSSRGIRACDCGISVFLLPCVNNFLQGPVVPHKVTTLVTRHNGLCRTPDLKNLPTVVAAE